MKTDTDTIEIFEYTNSNEYTKKEVYPVVEEIPVVPKGVYKMIPHSRTITKTSKIRKKDLIYERKDAVPVPIKYKIFTTSIDGKVDVQKIDDGICDTPIRLFSEVVGVAQQDALATVCGSEYKQKVRDIRDAKEAKDKWIKEWHEKNGNTVG
jgi:hypothetical protein